MCLNDSHTRKKTSVTVPCTYPYFDLTRNCHVVALLHSRHIGVAGGVKMSPPKKARADDQEEIEHAHWAKLTHLAARKRDTEASCHPTRALDSGPAEASHLESRCQLDAWVYFKVPPRTQTDDHSGITNYDQPRSTSLGPGTPGCSLPRYSLARMWILSIQPANMQPMWDKQKRNTGQNEIYQFQTQAWATEELKRPFPL